MESESWLVPRPWQPHLAIESTGAEATRMQNDTASKIHRKKHKRPQVRPRCDQFHWFDDIHSRFSCLDVHLPPFEHVHSLSLSLCRQFCNPMLPMLPSHFESSVQEAKGSWRLCENQQTSTTTWVCRMRGFEGLGQRYHLTGDYSMYMYHPWN